MAPEQLSPQLLKACVGHHYDNDAQEFRFAWTDQNQKKSEARKMQAKFACIVDSAEYANRLMTEPGGLQVLDASHLKESDFWAL